MSRTAWFWVIAFVVTFWLLVFTALAHAKCHTHACHKRVHAKRAAAWVKEHRPYVHLWRHESVGWRQWALATAQCESTGRWHIATGNGFYGGLQFVPQTWFSAQRLFPPHLRTTRLPHLVRMEQQAVVGIRFARRFGTNHWPVCGH